MFRALGRMLLASIFVSTSTGAIKNAEHMTAAPEALGLPEPVLMVQAHGVTNLLGGIMLGLGIKPKLSSWALLGNLALTTMGAHRFWEEDDDGARMNQQIHFFKNLGLMGGLLAVIAGERAHRKAVTAAE